MPRCFFHLIELKMKINHHSILVNFFFPSSLSECMRSLVLFWVSQCQAIDPFFLIRALLTLVLHLKFA